MIIKFTEEEINNYIKNQKLDTNKISDGYHTFGELYEHRFELYLALCEFIDSWCDETGLSDELRPWKSKLHSDGTSWEGWFIVGLREEKGKQISYHLPIKYWDRLVWMRTLDKAPEWDGHTSQDVLERLKEL